MAIGAGVCFEFAVKVEAATQVREAPNISGSDSAQVGASSTDHPFQHYQLFPAAIQNCGLNASNPEKSRARI